VGKSANHVLLMANLVIDGKKYGMHPFIVQVRDLSTHRPLPGESECMSEPLAKRVVFSR